MRFGRVDRGYHAGVDCVRPYPGFYERESCPAFRETRFLLCYSPENRQRRTVVAITRRISEPRAAGKIEVKNFAGRARAHCRGVDKARQHPADLCRNLLTQV